MLINVFVRGARTAYYMKLKTSKVDIFLIKSKQLLEFIYDYYYSDN